MQSYVEKLQKKAKFTKWSVKAVKIGLCDVPPSGLNAAMLTLFNSTSIKSLFTTVSEQFGKLYRKKVITIKLFVKILLYFFKFFFTKYELNFFFVKAHVHHYYQVNGFDAEYFKDCQDNLLSSIDMYHDLEVCEPVNVPRLSVLTY